MIQANGICDDRFSAVKLAFEENFKSHGDVGASFSVFKDGEPLVGLWGGHITEDRSEPWHEKTLVNVWSTTKGITATCFAMAVDRGALAYEDKVAEYWPEFGVAGKENVTVAMLLSHQAGLCGFRDPATLEDLLDIESAATRLAAAEPFWTPGEQSGYHALSMGALASSLLKRAEGRSVAQFVEDELRQGLGLDIFIGLPDSEKSRVSDLIAASHTDSDELVQMPTPPQIAAFANPPMEPIVANLTDWRKAEIPSANGHATANALAQLYSALASDGKINGKTVVSEKTLKQAIRPQIEGVDAVISMDVRWGCGFLLNADHLYGPNPESFGHSGWGGSFAFGDPMTGLGVAYTMNQTGTDIVADPRSLALIQAVYSSFDQ
ncbi:MAG: serine hydrolase domain-containing protein [Pseudomonadota bacterium]